MRQYVCALDSVVAVQFFKCTCVCVSRTPENQCNRRPLGVPVCSASASLSFANSPERTTGQATSNTAWIHNSRARYCFQTISVKNSIASGSISFSNRAPLVWNFLDEDMKTCSSSKFRTKFLSLVSSSTALLSLTLFDPV